MTSASKAGSDPRYQAVSFPGDSPATSRAAWHVVIAIAIALVASAGTINLYVSSMFLVPVTTDLGIARGTFSGGVMICQTVSAISCLLTGIFIDRLGPRRVLLIGIPLYAIATMLFSQLTASPVAILVLFAFAGSVSPSHSPLSYGTIVTRWFSRKLGLALGLALIGGGLGATVLPPLMNLLIGQYGWRVAYVALGAIVLLLSWIPTFLFIREPFPGTGPRIRNSGRARYLRSSHFWWMVAAFMLGVPSAGGAFGHIPALLADRGIDNMTTAWMISIGGACLIIGRILSGWLLDRCFAPYLTAAIFTLPIGGLLLLLTGWGVWVPFLAVILVAICLGAEVDLMAYLVARYFPLESFGQVYGAMLVVFSVAAGLGPWLAGTWYDQTASYEGIFWIFVAGLTGSVVLLATLGAYVYPPEVTTEG